MALPMPSIVSPIHSSKLPQFSKFPAFENQQAQTLNPNRLFVRRGSSHDDGSSSSELPVPSSSSSSSAEAYLKSKAPNKLEIGSPIIVTEAPQWIKTATAMPCLRVNSGLINAGDVGRIMSRKPKDVWAVRFRIGTYLIDGKYFQALELDERAVKTAPE